MNETSYGHGRVKEISSISNPLIKSVRSLQQKKYRDAENVFLVEGLKLVKDAIDNGWNCRTLIYAKMFEQNQHLMSVAATARANGTDILEVSEKILSSITKKDNPQMVMGVFQQKWIELDAIDPSEGDVWVVLDRIRDPGNLGTIIRTVDCVGAKGVILVGNTTDPYSVECVRATMGSIFNVLVSKSDTDMFLKFAMHWPGRRVGTHLQASSDYRTLNIKQQPVLLVMGNEQQGLPPQIVEACDDLAIIPMAGKADSLNLAVSTGIMLFELRRETLKVGDR